MPAAEARVRTGVPVLGFEPSWPAWARILGDYSTAARRGAESAAFGDGAIRHAPTADSGLTRRRIAVEVPGERATAWRRFRETMPGRTLRWRDPEDGVLRRATVAPEEGGIEARQVAERPGPPVWRSALVLTGWIDDAVEEEG